MSKYILVAVVTAAVVLTGTALVHAEPAAAKARWEYVVRELPAGFANARALEAEMQTLATQGWEFEAALDKYYVMKRAK